MRAISYTKWLQLNEPVEEFEVILADKAPIYFIGELATSYGMLQIVGIALQKLFKLRYNPFKNNTDQQICSEYIARGLVEYTEMEINVDFELVSPKDLYMELRKNGLKSTKFQPK